VTAASLAADVVAAAREVGRGAPYLLVGQSTGGILARRVAAANPGAVRGFLFIDSAHEEQITRFAAIAPQFLDAQFGPMWHDTAFVHAFGFLAPGERLEWATDRPTIVLEHGVRDPADARLKLSADDLDRIEAAWHDMQSDLARRASAGPVRKAARSGHDIHVREPDLVVAAIKELLDRPR
jgi:pimeloyl-ACP methyl ester carboxylesterase